MVKENLPSILPLPLFVILLQFSQKSYFYTLSGFSACGSMSTVSKDDNLALSSEDSSCPEESELELGLGLSLSSGSSSKSHHHHHARIYTAKDFPSSAAAAAAAASSPSSSSSSPNNITAGTKRAAADSLVANNRPRYLSSFSYLNLLFFFYLCGYVVLLWNWIGYLSSLLVQ